MNNYSLMRISTVLVLTVVLVTSTFAIPFLPRIGAVSLAPPDTPYNPDPADNATNISVYHALSWNCSDPDNDTLTFDICFGTSNPPDKVETGYPNMTYTPGTMQYFTTYYWQIIAWDQNNESTNGSIWRFTTKANTAPNAPENETPSNESTNVGVDTILSWDCSDPDGDALAYDVYLGATPNPLKVSSNQTGTSYDPALSYNNTFYWKIVAWDINKTKTIGPLWHFSTESGVPEPFKVEITRPLQGMFYFQDQEKMSLSSNGTIVYGPITIEANITSDHNITYVQFFADDKEIANVTNEPWSTLWRPIIQFSSALTLKRTITVIAHDSEGNNASANITITKWRFHPLPWIMAGLALASRLVLHTTVVGIFYNVQQSRFSVSFYAIQAHYKTVGPFQLRKGNIHFKHCSGGVLIGPTTLTRMGLFHKFAIGSFTFIGNVNIEKFGFGGSILSRMLSGGALLSGLLSRRAG
jgi:hypothetical protein